MRLRPGAKPVRLTAALGPVQAATRRPDASAHRYAGGSHVNRIRNSSADAAEENTSCAPSPPSSVSPEWWTSTNAPEGAATGPLRPETRRQITRCMEETLTG